MEVAQLDLKEFKAHMISELDGAYKKAPEQSGSGGDRGLVIPFPTGDGEYTLDNNKTTIAAVRKKVMGLTDKPTEMPRKHRVPTILSGVRKGVAPKLEYLFETVFPDESAWSAFFNFPVPRSPRSTKPLAHTPVTGESPYIGTRHWAIEKSAFIKPPTKITKLPKEGPYSPEIEMPAEKLNKLVGGVIENVKEYKSLFEVGRIKEPRKGGRVAVFYDGVARYAFNSDYIDYLHENIPSFSLRGLGVPLKPVIVMSGDRPVGVLMPREITQGSLIDRAKITRFRELGA